MKIITAPKIYSMTLPSYDWANLQEFLDLENLPEMSESVVSKDSQNAIVETAGRLCYMSFGKGRKSDEDYIRNLMFQGHGSVFEHINFGFIITGISRSLSHELVRHRHFSFSQLSQRFVDESDVAFVKPPNLPNELVSSWEESCLASLDSYRNLLTELAKEKNLSRKQRYEIARSVLPNCAETKIFVTGNARSWRHFISLRTSEGADAEIRRLANMILKELREIIPIQFDDSNLKYRI